MNLPTMRNPRRTQRDLPTTDQSLTDSNRKEEIRFPNIVVIEEIYHVSLEVIGIECPAAKWNGDPKLMLFITLAVQGNESQVVGVGELQ